MEEEKDQKKDLKEKVVALEKEMEEVRKKLKSIQDAIYKIYEDQRRLDRKL